MSRNKSQLDWQAVLQSSVASLAKLEPQSPLPYEPGRSRCLLRCELCIGFNRNNMLSFFVKRPIFTSFNKGHIHIPILSFHLSEYQLHSVLHSYHLYVYIFFPCFAIELILLCFFHFYVFAVTCFFSFDRNFDSIYSRTLYELIGWNIKQPVKFLVSLVFWPGDVL